jgi:hypothetical protein
MVAVQRAGCGPPFIHTYMHTYIHTTGLFYEPRMIDDDECGAVGGMRIDRENRSTRRKPVPVPHCPPQIPHDLTWARTRIATVGSRRLIA